MLVFEAFDCRDEGAHDEIGRAPGAQPRNDIRVIGIKDQHVMEIPPCEKIGRG